MSDYSCSMIPIITTIEIEGTCTFASAVIENNGTH